MQGTQMTSGNSALLFTGEIDIANAERFSSCLKPLIEAGGPSVVDLSGVTFMDSTGIHVLVEAAKALGKRGCIIVHGANGAVARVIEITQLGQARDNIHIIGCSVLVRAA